MDSQDWITSSLLYEYIINMGKKNPLVYSILIAWEKYNNDPVPAIGLPYISIFYKIIVEQDKKIQQLEEELNDLHNSTYIRNNIYP